MPSAALTGRCCPRPGCRPGAAGLPWARLGPTDCSGLQAGWMLRNRQHEQAAQEKQSGCQGTRCTPVAWWDLTSHQCNQAGAAAQLPARTLGVTLPDLRQIPHTLTLTDEGCRASAGEQVQPRARLPPRLRAGHWGRRHTQGCHTHRLAPHRHILPEGAVAAPPLQVVLARVCVQAAVDGRGAAALLPGGRGAASCCCRGGTRSCCLQLVDVSRHERCCGVVQDALRPYPRHLRRVLRRTATKQVSLSAAAKKGSSSPLTLTGCSLAVQQVNATTIPICC